MKKSVLRDTRSMGAFGPSPGFTGPIVAPALGMYSTLFASVAKPAHAPMLLVYGHVRQVWQACGAPRARRLADAALEHLAMAFLAAVMLASLVRAWPWSQASTRQSERHGESFPLEQVNLLPWQLAKTRGEHAQGVLVIVQSGCAIVLMLGMEWLARRRQPQEV